MIATTDVADALVSKLTSLQFGGKSVQPLLGPRDYALGETTALLGKAIGKANLPYIQFAPNDFVGGIMQTGGSADFAAKFLELMVATDNGLLNHHARNVGNTTHTTFEEFLETTFAPAYAAAA
jgi:uncharacterized protein YbjT (DUF2867 family)